MFHIRTELVVGILTLFLFSGWWLCQNLWLFPSRHDHGTKRGCGKIYMLPSSWMLPLGLDKWLKSHRAEQERKLPVLSLEDHERYGDTYGQYAGALFTILTRDPRNIASILSDQFNNFDYGNLRQLCFGVLLGEGIFTENGDEWKRSRRLLASKLHDPQFPALHILESHFQDLLRTIFSQLETSATVDFRPLFYNYTLDIATDLFMGVSTNLLSPPSEISTEGKRFSSAFNDALLLITDRERWKQFAFLSFFTQPPRRWRSCMTARDSLLNLIIEAQKQELGSTYQPFAEFLGKTTDIEKARDELMNLLFAGRDSNASLLCWLLYVLAREPAVFGKLENEVFSTLGTDSNTTPTSAQLAKMVYLEDVVHETLRLFPAVPINGRICRKTTTLPFGGSDGLPILVPKGALICFSTYGCHLSTANYGEDAAEFRPERWREVDVKTRTRDYTFHPFIGGPRKCLGENFALKLVKYTLCRLVQCFSTITMEKSSSRDDLPWQKRVRYQIGLTMSPDDGDGIVVNLVPR
ncbi:cytochrome P450 [Nemania serpens]|nr:cytochrome P450 [Nemania serpens]